MGRRYSLIFLLGIFLIGCRPASPTPTATSAIFTPTQPQATATNATSSSAQDVALLRNAKYQLGTPDTLEVVQLKDGKFERSAPGDPNYASIQLTDFVASGDLDGDGKNEIAALLAENYGGSGVFVYLAVFANANGTPTFISSTLVDDRPQLNSLSIKNSEILLDSVIHGIDDPMCCPALHVTRNYRLVDGQLDLTNYATFTQDGKPRTITLAVPADGTEVFNSIHVQGKVAIAPFENNLTYSIKDGTGVELSRGAVPVTAANPGGAGTFDATISLGNIISNTVVFLEIQDVSAADGTLLAMDSVELVVK
jgi:hypothetical protein